MLELLMTAPTPSPGPAAYLPVPSPSALPASTSLSPIVGDTATRADWLEAWSTFAGAIVALLAAVFTLWLLLHQIGEARRARADAAKERADAAADRELARQDRELAAAERRDAEKAQARTVVLGVVQMEPSLDGDDNMWIGDVRTRLHNFGDEPILNVTVELDNRNQQIASLPVVLKEFAVISPRDDVEVTQRVGQVLAVAKTQEEAFEHIVTVVRFTDAAGRRWLRREEEQPEQVFD